MNISQQIEALLFVKGEPQTKTDLAKILKVETALIEEGVRELDARLTAGGLALVEAPGGELTLATRAEFFPIIEALRKEELSKELSKPSLETLAIVLYGDLVTRADIDYIRGVNSQFILRNLLVRGLVERGTHPNDNRKIVYQPTLDLLAYLGVTRVTDLPDYDTKKSELARKVGLASELATKEE